MDLTTAKQKIDNLGVASRINRENAADLFEKPEYLPILMQLIFDTSFKNHHKAAWVLEILTERNIEVIYPEIQFYCSNLHLIKKDSAVRALSNITRRIAYDYVKKKNDIAIQHLELQNIKQILETAFDWLIGPYPTAPKAFSMDIIYWFGTLKIDDYDWIHEALIEVILQQINNNTPGFINHGNKILIKLKTKHS